MSGSLGEPTVGVIDRLLAEHARHLAVLQEHVLAHDEMNVILNRRIDTLQEYRQARDREDVVRDKRIDKLVERLDRAYTKIHNLEREVRTLKEGT